MELLGQVIVFIVGLVLVIVSVSDIYSRFSWGKNSERDPLLILVPVFSIGCGLIYLAVY